MIGLFLCPFGFTFPFGNCGCMDEINAWLQSSRNYVSGLALYDQHGNNGFLKKLFKSGASTYNVKKLADELQLLAGVPAAAYIPECKIAEPKAKAIPDQTKDHAKYLQLLKKRNELNRQIDRNMALLDQSKSKNVLQETAMQILRLHQAKTECWAQLDYYQDHGCFAPEAEVVERSAEKEIQYLYQSISKANKRLEKPDCRNEEKTRKLRDEQLARLMALKNNL